MAHEGQGKPGNPMLAGATPCLGSETGITSPFTDGESRLRR